MAAQAKVIYACHNCRKGMTSTSQQVEICRTNMWKYAQQTTEQNGIPVEQMQVCQDCGMFSIWLCSFDAVFCSIPADVLHTRCWSNITSKLTSESRFQLTGLAALAAMGAALAVAAAVVLAGIALQPLCALVVSNVLDCLTPSLQQHKSICKGASDK